MNDTVSVSCVTGFLEEMILNADILILDFMSVYK